MKVLSLGAISRRRGRSVEVHRRHPIPIPVVEHHRAVVEHSVGVNRIPRLIRLVESRMRRNAHVRSYVAVKSLQPGTYKFFCTVHRSVMHGALAVAS